MVVLILQPTSPLTRWLWSAVEKPVGVQGLVRVSFPLSSCSSILSQNFDKAFLKASTSIWLKGAEKPFRINFTSFPNSSTAPVSNPSDSNCWIGARKRTCTEESVVIKKRDMFRSDSDKPPLNLKPLTPGTISMRGSPFSPSTKFLIRR